MILKKNYPLLGLALLAQQSWGGQVPLGITPLPADTGGIAAAAVISLIIAAQIIKRRK